MRTKLALTAIVLVFFATYAKPQCTSGLPYQYGSKQANNCWTGVNLLTGNFLTDTGTANVYVVTPGTSIAAVGYQFGPLWVKISNTNTGPSTLQVDGLSAVPITKNGSALVGGELITGNIYEFAYDGFEFQIPSSYSGCVWADGIFTTVWQAEQLLPSTGGEVCTTPHSKPTIAGHLPLGKRVIDYYNYNAWNLKTVQLKIGADSALICANDQTFVVNFNATTGVVSWVSGTNQFAVDGTLSDAHALLFYNTVVYTWTPGSNSFSYASGKILTQIPDGSGIATYASVTGNTITMPTATDPLWPTPQVGATDAFIYYDGTATLKATLLATQAYQLPNSPVAVVRIDGSGNIYNLWVFQRPGSMWPVDANIAVNGINTSNVLTATSLTLGATIAAWSSTFGNAPAIYYASGGSATPLPVPSANGIVLKFTCIDVYQGSSIVGEQAEGGAWGGSPGYNSNANGGSQIQLLTGGKYSSLVSNAVWEANSTSYQAQENMALKDIVFEACFAGSVNNCSGSPTNSAALSGDVDAVLALYNIGVPTTVSGIVIEGCPSDFGAHISIGDHAWGLINEVNCEGGVSNVGNRHPASLMVDPIAQNGPGCDSASYNAIASQAEHAYPGGSEILIWSDPSLESYPCDIRITLAHFTEGASQTVAPYGNLSAGHIAVDAWDIHTGYFSGEDASPETGEALFQFTNRNANGPPNLSSTMDISVTDTLGTQLGIENLAAQYDPADALDPCYPKCSASLITQNWHYTGYTGNGGVLPFYTPSVMATTVTAQNYITVGGASINGDPANESIPKSIVANNAVTDFRIAKLLTGSSDCTISTTRSATTAYAPNYLVVEPNSSGYLFQFSGGVTGGGTPSWASAPLPGNTLADGSGIWTNVGSPPTPVCVGVAATTDTSGDFGIDATPGSGSAPFPIKITQAGPAYCEVDGGGMTAGDYVINSTVQVTSRVFFPGSLQSGACKDSTVLYTTHPPSDVGQQVIGIAQTPAPVTSLGGVVNIPSFSPGAPIMVNWVSGSYFDQSLRYMAPGSVTDPHYWYNQSFVIGANSLPIATVIGSVPCVANSAACYIQTLAGTSLTLQPLGPISTSTLASGGTGWNISDGIKVICSSPIDVQPPGYVSAVGHITGVTGAGGAVTTYTLTGAGVGCAVQNSAVVYATSGTGSNMTVNITAVTPPISAGNGQSWTMSNVSSGVVTVMVGGQNNR